MFALLPWSVFSVPEEQHYTNKEKISSHLTKTERHFETFWELTGRNLCFMRYKNTRNLQQDNSLKQEWAFIELPIQHRNQSRFLHLSLTHSKESFLIYLVAVLLRLTDNITMKLCKEELPETSAMGTTLLTSGEQWKWWIPEFSAEQNLCAYSVQFAGVHSTIGRLRLERTSEMRKWGHLWGQARLLRVSSSQVSRDGDVTTALCNPSHSLSLWWESFFLIYPAWTLCFNLCLLSLNLLPYTTTRSLAPSSQCPFHTP